MKARNLDDQAGKEVGSGAPTAFQQTLRWAFLVGLVTVATVLFSFLGTITCAVLAGVVLGTMRHRRWQAGLASLVFPAVVLALLRLSRADLVLQKQLVMAALCFAAFWVTYVLALLAMLLEDHGQPEPVKRDAEVAQAPSRAVVGTERSEGSPETRALVGLSDFQGRWLCDMPEEGGVARRRTMDITGDHFDFAVLNGDGRMHTVASGGIRIEWAHGNGTLILAARTDDAAGGHQGSGRANE